MRDDWAQTVSRKSNRRIYYPVGRQVIREIAHSGLHASSDIHYLIQRGLAGLLLDCNAADAEPLKYQEVVKCIDNIASQSDVSMRIVANYGDKLEVIEQLLTDLPGQPLSWQADTMLHGGRVGNGVTQAMQFLEKSFNLISKYS